MPGGPIFISVKRTRERERERERVEVSKSSGKSLSGITFFPIFLIILTAIALYSVFASPSITFIPPTLSDNVTTGSNWVYINLTSSENLNQSLLEWGNSTGFTNVSMFNSSATNWYVNMTNLTDGAYNYTIYAQNTTGEWNQTARRFVTVDTTPPTEPTLISPANNTNSTDKTPDLDWTTVTEQNFRNYTVQTDDNSAFSSPNYIYNTTTITESNYSITSAWADGKWYWRVIAYDNASNSNTSGYFAYTADTSAPAITLDYPRNGSVMRNGTWINLTITDLTSVNASWWSNNSGTTNYTLASPWDINTTGWSEGDKAIEVWANDSFGFLRRNTYTFRIDDTPPYNTTACQNLDIAGAYYTLTQNVSSSGTCFNILANNVTLDGAGFTVNYSQTEGGYGVNITGRNNVTVKNLNVVQGNSSASSAHTIYANGMTDSTITNNSITTSGTWGHGVFIESSSNSNTIQNNNITTSGQYGFGIYLTSASLNTFTNNNITATGSSAIGVFFAYTGAITNITFINNYVTTPYGGVSFNMVGTDVNFTGGSITGNNYAYGFRSSGSTNYFRNTGSGSKKIYFQNGDGSEWFNYNNDTNNIWLKTSTIMGSSTVLTRTLATWSQPEMKWNDTNSTSGVVVRYIITGLLPSTNYRIYNTSAGATTNSYTITTGSAGDLNFTINLNGNTEINVSLFTGNNPPTVILNSPINNYNQTSASITFNCTAYDDLNLTNVTLYNNFNGWQANGTNSSGINNAAYIFIRTAPTNGTFTWNCLAYDNSSQSSFASQNFTVTVDSVPPTSNAPSNAEYTRNSSATIGWILQDNYASGYYTIYRNGSIQNQSTWQNNTNLNLWANTSTQGTWNYTIAYNDSLGNNGIPNTVIINITGDLSAPKYSLNSTNSTTAGTSVKHSLYWQADIGLSEFIFSFDNGNGTFYNDSWVSFAGTGNWSNVSKTVNSTVGATIRWKVYANDTSNNWNASVEYIYVTTNNPPAYSSTGTNNTIANQSTKFYTYWTDDVGLSAYVFSTNNSGIWINQTYAFSGTGNWSNATITLNDTSGLSIGYRFYANDTNNQWNSTGILTLITTPQSQEPLGCSAIGAATYNAATNTITLNNQTSTLCTIYYDVNNVSVLSYNISTNAYTLNANITGTRWANARLYLNNSILVINSTASTGKLFVKPYANLTIENMSIRALNSSYPWMIRSYAYDTQYSILINNSDFSGGHIIIAPATYQQPSEPIKVKNNRFHDISITGLYDEEYILGFDLNAAIGAYVYNNTFENCHITSGQYNGIIGFDADATGLILDKFYVRNCSTASYGMIYGGSGGRMSNFEISDSTRAGLTGKEYGNVKWENGTIKNVSLDGIYLYQSYSMVNYWVWNVTIDRAQNGIGGGGNATTDIYDVRISNVTTAYYSNSIYNDIRYITNSRATNYASLYNMIGSLTIFREYVLADVYVIDSKGNPVSNATVNISSNTSIANYRINRNLQPITWTTTLANGHTPLPYQDNTSTLALLRLYKNSTNTISGFTYNISAYDPSNIWTNVIHTIYPNGTIQQLQPLANVSGVNPDSSWYRSDPNTYQNTTTLQINYTRTNITVNAGSNATNITVNRWNTSLAQGQILANFTAESVNGNNVNFTVCNLTASTIYAVKNDGAAFATKTANSQGCIWFNNSVWTSHTFTVEEQGGDSTPPIITIISPLNQSYSTNSIWFNLTINEPGSWAGVSIDGRTNATLASSSGNWNLLNSSMSNGFHNATFFANDTSNNMNSTSIYFRVDTIPPTWNGTSTSIVTTYSPTTLSHFNITWTDNIGISTVLLESNYSGSPSNYTMSHAGSGNYTFNATMPAGTYYWRSYANDTANNRNASTPTGFTVSKAANPAITMYINSPIPNQNSTIAYGTTTNVTITTPTSQSLALYRNGTVAASTTGASLTYLGTLASSFYNFTAVAETTQNYTASSSTYFQTINKAVTLVRLFLNGTEGDRNYNITAPQVNLTAVLNVTGKTIYLNTNITGWSLQSGTASVTNYTTITSSGIYNITAYFPGDSNYMASSQTYFANVSDATLPSIIIISPLNQTYPTSSVWFNITLNKDGSWAGFSIDGRQNSTLVNSSGNWNLINSSMSDGFHNATFYANDTSNNMDSTSMYFTVDTAPPAITITSPQNTTYGYKNISLNYSANEQLSYCLFSVGGTANQTLSGCQNQSIISREYASTSGILLWYHFNENSGTTVIDSAGNMNGTARNMSWSGGKFGSAGSFNGSSSYVVVNYSDALNLTNQVTIEAWVKPIIGTRMVIIARYWYNSTVNDRSYEFGINASGNVEFALNSNGTQAGATWLYSAATVPNNTWSHVLALSNGTTMMIFINGQQDSNIATAPASIYNSNRSVQIGAWTYDPSGTTAYYFNGTIDEVRILNKSLTVDEVQSDYMLSLGSHNITVYANDTVGNWNSTSIYFTIDTTMPKITVLSPANTTYYNNTIWFNITLNKAGSWAGFSIDGRTNNTLTNSSGNWNLLNNSMSEGFHNVTFYANDTSNNMNTTSVYFTIDTTMPKITVLSPANTTYYNNTIWFNITFNKDGSWAGFSIDGRQNSTLVNSSGNWNLINSSMSDGFHNATFYANDTSNNMNSTVLYFTVDTALPKITIQSPTNTTYLTNLVWFNITFNKDGSWAGFSIDGRPNATLTNSSGNWNLLNSSMSEGFHNVTFYANDTSNNMNSTVLYFTVDTVLPSLTIISPINQTYPTNLVWFNITLSKTGSWAGFSIDGRPNATMSNSSGNWNFLNSSMSDGIHTAVFHANDTAGNMNSTSITFTVDTTPPQITFNFPTWTNASVRSESWEYVNITLDEQGSTSLLEWSNATINANYTLMGSGTNFYINMTGQNGTVWYSVYANDTQGNMNVSEMRKVTLNYSVDVNPPQITVISPSNASYLTKWVWANVSLDEPGAWCGISLNGTANQTMSNVSTTFWYLNLSVPAEGLNNVTFYCNDTLGNRGPSTTTYFTIDTVQPRPTVQSPLNRTYTTNSIWFNLTTNEPASWAGFSLDSVSNNVTLSNSSGNWNFLNSSMSEGVHIAIFYANDTAGNMNTTNVTFKIDTIVPLLSILLPQNTTTYSTTAQQLNYTVSDANLDKAWYLYNNANTTLTDNTTFTALNNQQSTLYLYANDTAGNINTASVTFTVDTTPPTWNGTSTSIVTTYSPIALSYFNITWTDNTGMSTVLLESNYSGSPANYTMSHVGSGNYTFNATMPAGTYYWRSYANDTASNWNASTQISFTIGKAPNKLHIYLNGSLDSNQTMTYGTQSNATGTADNGLSVSLDFNGAPTGTNTHTAILGVATYNYTAYSAGNANYTTNSTIYYLTVQKAAGPAVTMYINSPVPNQNSTIAYGTTTNVTITTPTSQSLALYRNGTLVVQSSGTNIAYYDSYGSSYYNFTAVAETTENYTASYSTYFQTINKAVTLVRLFLNGTEGDRNYNVGTQANLTAILNTTPATIYLNTNLTGWSLQSGDTSVTSFPTLTQAGFYNITAYFPGDSNYMASSQTYFMNVSTIGSLELSADTNSSYLAGYTALLTGTFRWSNMTAVDGKTVSILWSNSTGSAKRSVNTTTNSTGGYNDTYPVPENAGTWTINVTGWLDSSNYVANSTGFQVAIPPRNQLQLNATIGNSTGQVPTGTTLKIYNSTFSSVTQLNDTVTSQMLEENKNYSLLYTLPSGLALDIRDLNVTANLTIEPILIDSYAGSLPGYQGLRSAVLALNDSLLAYGRAELTLPLNGTVNRILHCLSFNFSSFNCTSWESSLVSDFSAFSNSTTLKFNVTGFDAYAGSWYDPPTTPTPTPTSTSSAPAAGGGGGGGGGGGAGAPVVPGNKTILATILGPFRALQAIVDESLASPEINVNLVSSLPLGISQQVGVPYFYAEVIPNFNSSRYLRQAQIDFKVNKSWYGINNLSVASTTMRRYAGSYWQSLLTISQGEDTESYLFSANTTSFSLFAVTATQKKTATLPPALVTPTITTTVPTGTPSAVPFPTSTPTPTAAVGRVPFTLPPSATMIIALAVIAVTVWVVKHLVGKELNDLGSKLHSDARQVSARVLPKAQEEASEIQSSEKNEVVKASLSDLKKRLHPKEKKNSKYKPEEHVTSIALSPTDQQEEGEKDGKQ